MEANASIAAATRNLRMSEVIFVLLLKSSVREEARFGQPDTDLDSELLNRITCPQELEGIKHIAIRK